MTGIFLNPLWLVAVPILIHLINMLRHRRVRWAAMEFLLASQKRHRTWVIFKQLLLLLLRMAVVATVVVMLAWPDLGDWFAEKFGDVKPTHHIVLLDDSYSMADRSEGSEVIDRARAFVKRVCGLENEAGDEESADENGPITTDAVAPGAGPSGVDLSTEGETRRGQSYVTLLRFSRSRYLAGGESPDLDRRRIEENSRKSIAKTIDRLKISPSTAGPLEALEAIEELISEDHEENRVVYIVSDFREAQWKDAPDLRKRIDKLADLGVEVRLVACADPSRVKENLAVTGIRPIGGIRAAGVPMLMEVSVKNFSDTRMKQVAVSLQDGDRKRSAVTIPEIGPGEEVPAQFQIHFPTAGSHRTTVEIAGDPLAVDDLRHGVVTTRDEVPVLLIGDTDNSIDNRFIAWCLAPGGSIRTGIRPRLEIPRFLNHNALDEYAGIILTNVGRLDPSAVAALRQYVEKGGRIAIFSGVRVVPRIYNETLYRDGQGIFPAPIYETRILAPDPLENRPDLSVNAHAIFDKLSDERYNFFSGITITQYMATGEDWKPESDQNVEVLASLRGNIPFILEKKIGEGSVISIMTTAAPTWNDWAKSPSFVIMIQNMAGYLALRPHAEHDGQVGQPMLLDRFSAAEYEPQIQVVPPSFGTTDPDTTDLPEDELSPGIVDPPEDGTEDPSEEIGGEMFELVATAEEGMLRTTFDETDNPGLYEVRLTRKDDATMERCYFAYNLNPSEGDLSTIDQTGLGERLSGIPFVYQKVALADFVTGDMADFNLSEWLLYILVLLLIGEMLMAWSCSYHPPARGGRGERKKRKARSSNVGPALARMTKGGDA